MTDAELQDAYLKVLVELEMARKVIDEFIPVRNELCNYGTALSYGARIGSCHFEWPRDFTELEAYEKAYRKGSK